MRDVRVETLGSDRARRFVERRERRVGVNLGRKYMMGVDVGDALYLECVRRAFEFETLPHFAAFCRVCECGRISVVFKNEYLPERPIRISFPFLAEPS